ncbi:pollen-specific leucine-rich repeat extensin-like protein 4 [Iris pallida]|uniref:Pollen-specific leucine-rich repeat extensin-like protein 4 n=1 Tax=Iris pallida TaxID=29817 RepID=A0AAX6GAU8_IRIPA|nr:pollen-specific leucine-rich repeat extensin-like protein 4 [Iris pallida]
MSFISFSLFSSLSCYVISYLPVFISHMLFSCLVNSIVFSHCRRFVCLFHS